MGPTYTAVTPTLAELCPGAHSCSAHCCSQAHHKGKTLPKHERGQACRQRQLVLPSDTITPCPPTTQLALPAAALLLLA